MDKKKKLVSIVQRACSNDREGGDFFRKCCSSEFTDDKTGEKTTKFVFDVNNMVDMSCILQPLFVSPMINFGDVLSALKGLHGEGIVSDEKIKEV